MFGGSIVFYSIFWGDYLPLVLPVHHIFYLKYWGPIFLGGQKYLEDKIAWGPVFGVSKLLRCLIFWILEGLNFGNNMICIICLEIIIH